MTSPKKTTPAPKAPKPPSTLAKVGRFIGDVSGVGGIARTVLAGEKAVIENLVKTARAAGVPEPTIKRALAVKRMHDRAASVAAILFPFLPNPAILRLLAGESLDDLREPAKGRPKTAAKKSAPQRPAGKRGGR